MPGITAARDLIAAYREQHGRYLAYLGNSARPGACAAQGGRRRAGGAGIGDDAIAPDPGWSSTAPARSGRLDARAGRPGRPAAADPGAERAAAARATSAGCGPCSRADLARLSGLSKPTVSLALANVERSGLVRAAGQRTGVPGRSALLYEIRPDAGYVLGLDIGQQYLRGALADLSGQIIGPGRRSGRVRRA